MAIRFRGALNDFSQLEYGYCPPEAVPIKEGDNLENVIMQALRQALPLFILTGALAVVRLVKGLNWTGEFSFVYMLIVMLLWSVLYFALIVLHELITPSFFRDAPPRMSGFTNCRQRWSIATRPSPNAASSS